MFYHYIYLPYKKAKKASLIFLGARRKKKAKMRKQDEEKR